MFRRLGSYDAGLWFATLAILATSVYLLLTAVVGANGLGSGYGYKQLVFAIVGCGVALALAQVDLDAVRDRWLQLYALCVGSIAVVFVLGTAIRGSRRWIELGPVNLQPSETGKVLVILAVAGFVASRARDVHSTRTFAQTLTLCALPAVMVFLQPDFGTSQVYGYIALALVFFAGCRWLHLGALFGSVALLAIIVVMLLPAVGVHVLKPFQMQRLTGFVNPEADPQGSNFHAIQAKIAIGSGQAWGKPAGEASQVKKAFLPEPHTDFIFATLSERHGFVGGAIVLALYMLLISRILQAVAVAPTLYGRLVCSGVAALFFAQVLINVGMVIGLMPITGVPLPLMSYGGSAMVANPAALGLVSSVLRASQAAPVRYARRVGTTRIPVARMSTTAAGRDRIGSPV